VVEADVIKKKFISLFNIGLVQTSCSVYIAIFVIICSSVDFVKFCVHILLLVEIVE